MGTVRRAVVITCLHGFLGAPRDWDFLREAGLAIQTPPLDAIPPHGEILLGYSLGSRLALNALLSGARYERAIFVSTGLGIEDDLARSNRRASDEAWAWRFETEDFDSVVAGWNAQPVLAGPALSRTRDDYDSRGLREWSSGALPPIASRLQELTIPTLWIAGERDAKYVAEAKRAASLAREGRTAIIGDTTTNRAAHATDNEANRSANNRAADSATNGTRCGAALSVSGERKHESANHSAREQDPIFHEIFLGYAGALMDAMHPVQNSWSLQTFLPAQSKCRIAASR